MSQRISKLLFLFLTMIVGLIFLVLPRTEPKDWFLCSDMKVTFQTHVYFICMNLSFIMMAYIIASHERHWTFNVFFWLLVAELVDYCLTYNSVWFSVVSFPVSMNIVKSLTLGTIIAYQWIKERSAI